MKYSGNVTQGWAVGVIARVFDKTIDDVTTQWSESGAIDVSGGGINVNHLFQGESYRETAERYSGVLKHDVRRGYSEICVREGIVLSVVDICSISGRIYAVLLDKATSAVVMPIWIEVDIYTRQTIIYTKN